MPDYYEMSVAIHQQLHGKISVSGKLPVDTVDAISIAYTPGVGRPCELIAKDPNLAYDLTIKRNTVAVVTDGSSVLGLGNIGPMAALPVMEGKSLLLKAYGGVDAWPICLDTQDTEEIIRTIRNIAPGFGAINLEDISSPRCFEIEGALQDLGIPVFHDDQHGTAAVVLAGLINACRALKRPMQDLQVVVCGAGAAGIAIARILHSEGVDQEPYVRDLLLCDSQGVVHRDREDLTPIKQQLLNFTNHNNRKGSIQDALKDADVFIGVSRGDLLNADNIRSMAKDPIVFALANPYPEIDPAKAKEGGAAIVATGRSDFPNQVNNALIFPGIFRGALDARAPRIDDGMIHASALALSEYIENPTVEQILPDPLDPAVAKHIAKAVVNCAKQQSSKTGG